MERRNVRYVEVKNEYKHLYSFIESFPAGEVCSIMLFGPPGTAKTTLAIKLAQDFKSDYEVVDGSEEIERRDLEGVWVIKKEEGTVFVPGTLVKAIQGANKNKIYFLIMNEPNAIRPTEQIGFNSLLSEGHVNLFSNAGERYEIEPDAKLVVIGTMNLNVLGVNELQEAFDDRFWMNKLMEYAPAHVESKIICEISGCKKEVADLIVDVAQEFRKSASPQHLSIPKMFSTRLAVNFAKMITRMKTDFIKENIRDMIVNKLAKEPAELATAEGIIVGKDLENKLYDLFTDKPAMSIDVEEKERILKEVEDEEKVVSETEKPKLTYNAVNSWTRKEIKEYMRKNGITGYSGKVKDDLIKMVLDHQKKMELLKDELKGISDLF